MEWGKEKKQDKLGFANKINGAEGEKYGKKSEKIRGNLRNIVDILFC